MKEQFKTFIRKVAPRIAFTLALGTAACNAADQYPYTYTQLGPHTIKVTGNGDDPYTQINTWNGIYDLNRLCSFQGLSAIGSRNVVIGLSEEDCKTLDKPNPAHTYRVMSAIETPDYKLTQVSRQIVFVHPYSRLIGLEEVAAQATKIVTDKCGEKMTTIIGSDRYVLTGIDNCTFSLKTPQDK